MKNTGLKIFDIASFDMEIEFNKQLAPIRKKIETLNRNHEKKSLDNHKDFLAKEKKSKKKLNQLSEKAILRDQRITIATENKLKKYVNIDSKLNARFDEFKKAQKKANDLLLDEINEVIEEMKIAEEKDIELITRKYEESVHTYTEKLSTYNENFVQNVERHTVHLDKYQKLVDKKIKEINEFKENSEKILDQELADFIKQNELRKEEVSVEEKEKQKEYTKNITQIKRQANLKIKEIKQYVETVQHELAEKYDAHIKGLKEHISMLNTDFSHRKELIIKDRDINLEKLQSSLTDDEQEISAKQKKAIDMKLEIFEERASTTIKYEEAMLKEHIKLIEAEITEIKETKRLELLNYDKLEVILLSDQNELKESGDFFKEINFQLLTNLNQSEFTHSDYLEKHEKLKNEYFKHFNDIFNTFKLALLEANQSTIERLGQINHEIDEINKYLDTAEPLKEIEVNNIRVDIEKSEVIERYKMKYAKQNHEIKLLNCNMEKEIMLEEQKIRKEIIENNKAITDIKNKEKFDKDIEKAKLKFQKAEEIARLRHNSIRLERSLLKSSYETEMAIMDHKKESAQIEFERENALVVNEFSNHLENYEIEAQYKIEVINQSLIEENLRLDDEINGFLEIEKANSVQIDREIKEIKADFEQQKSNVEKEFANKSKLVDKALERELKEPRKSLQKSNQVIDDRLRAFYNNDELYKEFINNMIVNMEDTTLNDEQRKSIMIGDSMFVEKSKNYINTIYDTLQEAVTFIHELEMRSAESKLASATDDSKTRKINKSLQKAHQEFDRQTVKLDENRKTNLKLITDDIYRNIEEIGNFDVEADGNIAEFIKNMLVGVQSGLQSLQSGVLDEVKAMYSILTVADEAIIKNAEDNAVKAKALIEQQKANALRPFETDLQHAIDAKEQERLELNADCNAKIAEIKDKIRELKANALEQVRIIEEEKNELARPYKDQVNSITSGASEKAKKLIEQLDARKNDLERQYRESLNKLSLKETESEKILDYEKRIYTLAQETAQARLNDNNVKSENAYLSQLAAVEKKKAQIYETYDKTVVAINKELVELTKQFENNIFTVRPRLEESIGDAQKVIDSEMKVKKERLESLNDLSENVMSSLETTMLTKYQECYSRLLDNLQFYFDKLKQIKDEHMRLERDNNDVIEDNNDVFSHALFELSKSKHQKTLTKLLAINSEMTGKED